MAFQGGQTPIQRRLPKRGFRNPFPTDIVAINVASLEKLFDAGATVDLASLVTVGLVDKRAVRVKILGNGDLTRKLSVVVHAISAGARAKIEAAGGSVEVLPDTLPPAEGTAKG